MPGNSNSGGANRLPTKLKVLKGTARKDRLNPTEPEPNAVHIPKPPSLKLGKYAMDEWTRVTRELVAVNVLTVIDYSMLEAYCYHWGEWRKAMDTVEEEGQKVEVFRIADDGKAYLTGTAANPSVKIAKDHSDWFFKAGTSFGLTPTSRSKINAPKKKESDPFDEL